MTIPNYQELYAPILTLLSDGVEWKSSKLYESICAFLKLNDEERARLLPSGSQVMINNRCLWSLFYMKKAMLVKSVKRGYYQITESGLEFIKNNKAGFNNEALSKIDQFNVFLRKGSPAAVETEDIDSSGSESPSDKMENGYSEIKLLLLDDLLDRLKSVKPAQFEHIVLDVMLKMGYGGSRIDAGQVVGKSGDGGIDGVIKEDRLGLDSIYIQAKRWEGTVGRPEVQKFVGALQMHRAKKGVFITTSGYSAEAKEYVNRIEQKITLIDGVGLCELMIEYNVGVSLKTTYMIKNIDSDYFEE